MCTMAAYVCMYIYIYIYMYIYIYIYMYIYRYGTQQPIALLRQLFDYAGWYSRDKLTWREIQNVQVGMSFCTYHTCMYECAWFLNLRQTALCQMQRSYTLHVICLCVCERGREYSHVYISCYLKYARTAVSIHVQSNIQHTYRPYL